MAEEEKDENQNSDSQTKEKKSGSNIVLVIIVFLLVLVLAIGGIVAYLMLSADDDVAAQVPQERVEKKKKNRDMSYDTMGVGPMYPLDKFTVNLMSENGRRYLVVKINLEEDSEDLTPELDKKNALIRDIIISILSSKTVEEITTAKGKAKLKEEIITQINRYLEDGEIKHVYFTEFVIQ